MPASVIDTPTVIDISPSGSTAIATGYSIPAGTDRVTCILLHQEIGGSQTNVPVSGSFGGVSLTSAVSESQTAGTFRSPCHILFLKETDIASVSGSTLALIYPSGSPADATVTIFTLDGVEQGATTVNDTGSSNTTSPGNPPTFAIDAVLDGIVVAMSSSGNTGVTPTWTYPGTALTTDDDASSTSMIATEVPTATATETVSVALASSNRATLAAVSFNPAPGGSAPQTIQFAVAGETNTANAMTPIVSDVTVPVGVATENSSAQPIGIDSPVSVAFAAAASTVAALAVTAVPAGASVPFALATSNESANLVNPGLGPQTVVMGLASETDSAFGVSPAIGGVSIGFGVAASNENAFAVGATPGALTVPFVVAVENDSAFNIDVSTVGSVAFGIASSTNTAFAVTPVPGSVTQQVNTAFTDETAVEVSVALGGISVALGGVSENNSANAIGVLLGNTVIPLVVAVGSEAALPFDVGSGALIPFGLAVEIGAGQAIQPVPGGIVQTFGQAFETGQGLVVNVGLPGSAAPFDTASETNTAFPFTAITTQVVGFAGASETDSALPVAILPGPVTVPFSEAQETDSAFAMGQGQGGAVAPFLGAVETNVAASMTPVLGVALVNCGSAFEDDSALSVLGVYNQFIGFDVANESNVANVVTGLVGALLIDGVVIEMPPEPSEIAMAAEPSIVELREETK